MLSYTLTTDPWSSWLTRPVYTMGCRIGDAGAAHPAHRHPFPSHEAALRASLGPSMPHPLAPDHAALTPSSVMDLRVSVRSRIPDFLSSPAGTPCVRYNAELDGYELHVLSNVLCWSRDLAVVAALLRGERFEPGFISRVLDPAYLATEIALDADAREAERRRRASLDAHMRSRAREAEEVARETRRRAPAPSDAPPDLSLDDLNL